jgi:hypothetical protein|tara:strand:+ start:66 stop:401 length:336 start_codon:yes stop_codon:yes gene_type:complete
MSAGTYNFTIEQGTTFSRVLTLQENGSAMNLTGYSVASQMRSTHDSSSIVATFSGSVTNASSGQLTLSLTNSQTSAIDEAIYVYDVEITSGAGAVTRILEGNITVTPEVTR